MRRTISAQSWASVPPVPAWIETIASPASYSPEKSASSWRRCELLAERLHARVDLVELPVAVGHGRELAEVAASAVRRS